MANIAEYLKQIQILTKKNLEILEGINNSFFTKQEHLRITVGDADYVIPSFISLENKINALQENFENLVYAPKCGEAVFNMDGNTRHLEMRGYTCTPHRVKIDISKIDGFTVEQNDVFKDMLTPNPFIRVDLSMIPNDITQVNVRKIAIKSDELKAIIAAKFPVGTSLLPVEWADLYKILYLYKEDQDYIMYDTRRNLPIHQMIGTGEYTIKSIDEDVTDANLDEYITLTFHEDLKYKQFDETIEKYISVGDQLVTYDDSAKMEVVMVNPSVRQLKVKVLNGDYLNLVADPEGGLSSDMCKLKFYAPIDFNNDKYINIPLEEDQYIAVFVAPLSRQNIQSPWGGGIYVDTNEIRWTDDSQVRFKDYYEANIRNIGDILYEMSAAMTSSVMKWSEDDFTKFTQYQPIIDTNKLKVVQINKHINDSVAIKTIRDLYAQKQDYQNQLTEVKEQISKIKQTLSEIAFNDTTGIRETYEEQLAQYNTKQNNLLNSLSKVSNEMATSASNSEVPIENAKYHIRGYYQWLVRDTDKDPILAQFWKYVCGIKVQYRYKNKNNDTGSAVSIDENFIFSDWNDMDSFNLQKIPTYDGGYKFGFPQYTGSDNLKSHDNGRLNEPSFNQIDIPISQGETVDIRLKIVWDFGSPFIETTSNWSSIVNIEFPTEFVKDVQITNILEANQQDLEEDRFRIMLDDKGVTEHIGDELMDQNVKFFHQPKHIASGFYTEERRVIPLDEKLKEMSDTVVALQDIINGTSSENLAVSVIVDDIENSLQNNKVNTILVPAYDTTSEKSNNKPHVEQLTIQIANASQHTIRLHSLFPATNDLEISQITNTKFTKADYAVDSSNGIWLGWRGKNANNQIAEIFGLQTANQWATFRLNNVYSGEAYYSANGGITTEENPTTTPETYISSLTSNDGLIVYPYLSDEAALKIKGQDVYGNVTLAPGEALIIPIMAHYRVVGSATEYTKTISFDLRTSLYNDPINYIMKIVAPKSDSQQSAVARANRSRLLNKSTLQVSSLKTHKYNTLIKN